MENLAIPSAFGTHKSDDPVSLSSPDFDPTSSEDSPNHPRSGASNPDADPGHPTPGGQGQDPKAKAFAPTHGVSDSAKAAALPPLAVVVGAGVAGLQAARALLRAGRQVLVLEQASGMGGVWRSNYKGFGLQVPWNFYTFPEFPYTAAPEDVRRRTEAEGYPAGGTVQDYILAYCRHFGLERYILYGTRVVGLSYDEVGGRWSVCFTYGGGGAAGGGGSGGAAGGEGQVLALEAEIVVMATGMFYNPYVPYVQGLASFRGTVLHAKDLRSATGLRERRVLVLGAGKTALDVSVAAAEPAVGAAAVTTLFRAAHWPLPRRLMGLDWHRVFYTRAAAAMMPPYYTAQNSLAKRIKHGLAAPLKGLFWGCLQGYVSHHMGLAGELRPRLGFVEDVFYGGMVQDGSWHRAVRAGAISAVQGSILEVLPDGVRLAGGKGVLPADVLIFATGYTKDYSLFDEDASARLAAGGKGLHLYRSMIAPRLPGLYFIGCEASTFNNVLTIGLQSLWMLHHLTGSLALPAEQAMLEDIAAQQRWRRGVMPQQRHGSSSILLYQQRYHDQLVADIGHPTRRKRAAGGKAGGGGGGGGELFGSYTSEDYAPLFEDAAIPNLHKGRAPYSADVGKNGGKSGGGGGGLMSAEELVAALAVPVAEAEAKAASAGKVTGTGAAARRGSSFLRAGVEGAGAAEAVPELTPEAVAAAAVAAVMRGELQPAWASDFGVDGSALGVLTPSCTLSHTQRRAPSQSQRSMTRGSVAGGASARTIAIGGGGLGGGASGGGYEVPYGARGPTAAAPLAAPAAAAAAAPAAGPGGGGASVVAAHPAAALHGQVLRHAEPNAYGRLVFRPKDSSEGGSWRARGADGAGASGAGAPVQEP